MLYCQQKSHRYMRKERITMKTKQLRQISLILAALTAAGTMLACGDAAEKTPADDTLDTTPQTRSLPKTR